MLDMRAEAHPASFADLWFRTVIRKGYSLQLDKWSTSQL
jgi:hypothetical protein